MNIKRAVAATVGASVAYLIVTYLAGVVLFASAYAQPFYRSPDELDRLVLLALLAMPVGCAALVCLYATSVASRYGVFGGLVLGLLIAILLICFASVPDYVTLPMHGTLAALYLLAPVVRMSLCGAVVGWIYRPRNSSHSGGR